ncbi:protein LOW PSII ACCUMULATION 1, chloroplastic-like [Triticum dicoccoides]|uniref:protein LOW PSII ACCUMULATION 1, chloroplastic-like n=1 Tax=Triticum dicoccoides TaxID=85692 RepID=UPI00188ED5FC|nr:protein LOW PSII ACCUMULATION 1, chloroplastic-like [Triticum dicoccoides]
MLRGEQALPSPFRRSGQRGKRRQQQLHGKIRSEVLLPFRSVRMFFYLAFMASAGLGSLIALTQLLPALGNPTRAAGVPETLKGLGIDVAAITK